MNTSKNGGLSRRELLGGIGTLGTAVGLTVVGSESTAAVFEDRSRFTVGVVSGEVDLRIPYTTSYTSDGTTDSVSGTVDGTSAPGLDVTEIEPGDEGRIEFSPKVLGNPAYLWLCGGVTESAENGYPDPEGGESELGKQEWPSDGPGGEIGDALQASLRYRSPDDDVELLRGSLAELLEVLRYGIALDGTPDYGAEKYEAISAPGRQTCFDASGEPRLRLDWWMPLETGNSIISDTFEFELVFHARQCRHNDGTENPCAVRKGISFAAFCAETEPEGAKIIDITERTDEDEPVAFAWTSDEPVETVVLYYGRIFENVYVDGATSGTVRVGEGNVRLPGEGGPPTAVTGQSPPDPAPPGQAALKYESDGGGFDRES